MGCFCSDCSFILPCGKLTPLCFCFSRSRSASPNRSATPADDWVKKTISPPLPPPTDRPSTPAPCLLLQPYSSCFCTCLSSPSFFLSLIFLPRIVVFVQPQIYSVKQTQISLHLIVLIVAAAAYVFLLRSHVACVRSNSYVKEKLNVGLLAVIWAVHTVNCSRRQSRWCSTWGGGHCIEEPFIL